MNRGRVQTFGHARVGVDFDFGDMAAVRERLRCVDSCFGVQAIAFLPRVRRECEQRNAPVGADHLEISFAVRHIGIGRFQHPGGDRLCLLQHQIHGLIERAADCHGRA